MYAGKEATAEFGDYHSNEAVAHIANFCIGDLVETSNGLAVTEHVRIQGLFGNFLASKPDFETG